MSSDKLASEAAPSGELGAAVVIQGLTCPAENQWDQRRDLGPRGGRGVRYC